MTGSMRLCGLGCLVALTALGCSGDAGGGSSGTSDGGTSDGGVAEGGDSGTSGQARIYATVVSHNEDDGNTNCKNGPNNDPAKYAANRALLKKLAEGVVAHGAAYDQQNEWTYLSRVADSTYETAALTATTGGKNIIAYLASLDAQRISVDVHHHKGGFGGENHADVAGRLQQLGVSEQGVVGGFLASPVSMSEVEQMQGYAKSGLVSTKAWGADKVTWFPKVLWGGGTAGHTDDSTTSGVWRPKDNSNFTVDDPSAPLPNVGNYKGNLDFTGLADLVAKQTAGTLKRGQMYTVTLMVNQCELTDASVGAVLAEIDKYQSHVAAGRVVWKTVPAIVAEWRSAYGSAPQIDQP